MLPDDRLVQFGYDETDPESNQADVQRAHPGLVRFTGPQVRADPLGCASRYEPSGAALARYVDVVAGSLAAALSR